MGEVYKARDTRLDRLVAIKILPAHLADLPELRERFEREARTIAQLNHPHICTLFDIGSQEVEEEESEVRSQKSGEKQVLRRSAPQDDREKKVRVDYLVLEFLDGETLSERLKKGPLPVEQVLQYATEISSALDKAHRDGFTHRDIKPGNIMLVPQSGAGPKMVTKVLDFGLAKLKQEVAKATTPLSEMPTVQGGLTQHGTLLGTLQYMSPEQIEGKVNEIDHRTDVFAFGAMVYEMGTGKRAFPGETQASVIAKVLESDPPPMSSLQPMTPPAFDRVVKRCLAKDKEDRWQTMRDLCHELTWIKGGGGKQSTAEGAGKKPVPKTWRRVMPWGVAAVAILIAAIAVSIPRFGGVATEERMAWLSILPPENTTFTPGSAPVLSPDGRRLAYVASSGGKLQLWVRSLDSPQAQPLVGTEYASFPFWSPDSRFLGFFADGKLKKIDVSGGPGQTLTDAPIGLGGAWSGTDVIVFSGSAAGGLRSVPAAGGTSSTLTTLEPSRGETSHRWPSFLPDGRHFLYFSLPTGVNIGSLDSKETKLILNDQSKAIYAAPSGAATQGHLLFVRQGALMAQPFNTERLEASGDAFPMAQDVGWDLAWTGSYAFSISEGGLLSYRSLTQGGGQLAWFDRAGKPLGSVAPPGQYRNPRLSPDGTQLAVERNDENSNSDIWLVDLRRGIPTRFTFDPGPDVYPHWSPDGSRIVFRSFRQGAYDIYQKPSSGAGNEESLLKSSATLGPTDWSPDGRYILYTQQDDNGNFHPWALPTLGDTGSPAPASLETEARKPFQLFQSSFTEAESQVSPDGRWVAYTSNESGRYEVYIQSFPKPSGKWQVSNGGGAHPRWRRDGKELFYVASDRKMMAAPITISTRADSTIEAGAPVPLFEARTLIAAEVVLAFRQQYDVTPDGQRFLMNVEPEGASAASPFTVVLNWQAGVGVKK